MKLIFKPADSLEIVQEYYPENWVKTIEPIVRQMCHEIENTAKSFQTITTLMFEAETDAVKSHNILAAHKHIQNQLLMYKELVNTKRQYANQLVALEQSQAYTQQDKNTLRLFYQSKIEALTTEQTLLLTYDEVLCCLDLKTTREILN